MKGCHSFLTQVLERGVLVLVAGATLAGQGVSFVQPVGTPLTFPNGGGSIGIAQGDFNNDGLLDIAVTQQTNVPGVGNRGFLSILLGRGDGTFQAPNTIALPTSPVIAFGYGIIARDFNGDGNLDLALASAELRQVLYFQGNGDGTFGSPAATTLSQRPSGLQVADLNNDGFFDLVTVNSQDNSVSVLLGNGDGTFQTPTNYTVPTNPQDAAVADVDGVNGPDIVVGAYDGGSISVLLNDGTGRFPAAPLSSNPRGQVTGLHLADFDGDGKLDVVAGIAAGPVFMSLVFMKGNGDGTFATPPDTAYTGVENFPGRVLSENVPLDLNGDGIPDVLFRCGTNNYLIAGLGDGTGGFPTISHWVASGGSGDGTVPVSFVVADFNGDGVPDIAAAIFQNNLPGGVSILLGTTGGSFLAPRSYQQAPGAGGLVSQGAVVGDFHNTGNLDVAVVGTEGDPWLVQLLPGNGDGTLGTPIGSVPRAISGTGEFFSVVKAADLNADGNLDLIWHGGDGVQAGPPPRILVANGTGAGGFTLAAIIEPSFSGGSPDNFALGDFNHDGLTDLVLWVNRGCGFLSCAGHLEIFINNPTQPGTFTLTAGFPQMDLGNVPNQTGRVIGVGDFDGDGNPDIVVRGANSSGGIVLMFFKGKGDGTFQTPTLVDSALPSLNDIAVADLNGDGHPDLVEVGGNGAYIQLGNGDGTFQPAVYYATGAASQSGVVADFNGDGIPDLGIGNGGSPFVVLPGNGNGTFGAPVAFATGSNDQWASVGDLNGDQQPDVVLLHPGTNRNSITVLLNNSAAPGARHKPGR